MSDRDYGVLLDAVAWISQHAGVDAPDYPYRDRLAEVVNNISQRRQPDFEVAHTRPGGRRDFSTLSGLRDQLFPDQQAVGPAALPSADDTPA
jgi:hypothetical protein